MPEIYTFAVGTHSFLTSVRFTRDWDFLDMQVLSDGHHYGIGLFDDGSERFIAKRRRRETLTAYRRSDSQAHTWMASDSFNLGPDYRFIHQIALDRDRLYIANTDFNSVVRVRWGETACVKHNFNGHVTDVNHVNSVFPVGSESVLCLLHNRGDRLSEVALLSQDPHSESSFSLVWQAPLWHTGCHNVFTDGEILAYNASAAGLFVVVDLRVQRVIRELAFPGHTKGLSVLRDYFVIGFSDHAEREKRRTTNGQLAVIDRNNLDVVRILDLNHAILPHPIGNVNEVRCTSHLDFGHRALNLDVDKLAALRLSGHDPVFHDKRLSFKATARSIATGR